MSGDWDAAVAELARRCGGGEATTSDLVDELRTDGSVVTVDVGPGEKAHLTVPGPATVMVVLD